jgi:hypothetical protein
MITLMKVFGILLGVGFVLSKPSIASSLPPTKIDRKKVCRDPPIFAEVFCEESSSRPRPLPLLSSGEANVFDDHEKMAGVGRRRSEAEMPIKGGRLVILGVNSNRADADHVGDL